MEMENIDLTEKIRAIVGPLTKRPETLLIRRLDKEEMLTQREQHYLVVCDDEDLGRVIGRHGINSNAIRTLVNVVARKYKKSAYLTFESFGQNED